MGYAGGWGNLKQNMDRVKANIADKRKRGGRYERKKGDPASTAAKNRKLYSLVEHRQRDLRKVRMIYLAALLVFITLLYVFL